MGPVMEGAGLNVTVLSYRDNVDFGFLAAAELVPDVWDLADHIEEAMAEVLAAAAAETARPADREEPGPETARTNGAAREAKGANGAKSAPPKAKAAKAKPKPKPAKKPKATAPATKPKAKAAEAAKAPATGATRSPRR
jgi:outer membrane biosynthesis protein TonB